MKPNYRLNHIVNRKKLVNIINKTKSNYDYSSLMESETQQDPEPEPIVYDPTGIAVILRSTGDVQYVDTYQEAVTILKDNPDNMYDIHVGDDCDRTNVANVPRMIFDSITNLINIYLGDNVMNIDYGAFNNCQSIVSVTGMKNVGAIGQTAFCQCINLESISLQDSSVQVILQSAFMRCHKLKSVVLPNTFRQFVGGGQFQRCYSLQSLIIPDEFEGVLSNNLCDMQPDTWYENELENDGYIVSSLTNVYLGNCSSIGDQSFNGCDKLTTLEIPSSCQHIGDNAFYRCWNLTDITFNEGLLAIDHGAFDNCKRLSSIHLPESLQSISQESFGDCDYLEEVYIGSGIQNIAVGPPEPSFCKHASHVAFESKPIHFTINKPQGTFIDNMVEWAVPEGSYITWIG